MESGDGAFLLRDLLASLLEAFRHGERWWLYERFEEFKLELFKYFVISTLSDATSTRF